MFWSFPLLHLLHSTVGWEVPPEKMPARYTRAGRCVLLSSYPITPVKPRRTRPRRWPSRILHHPVIDLAEAQADDVERVILIEPPRPLRALLRHLRDRTLHIAGRKIQRRQFGDRGIDIVRHALLVAMPVHVIEQAADIFTGQVAFQRP